MDEEDLEIEIIATILTGKVEELSMWPITKSRIKFLPKEEGSSKTIEDYYGYYGSFCASNYDIGTIVYDYFHGYGKIIDYSYDGSRNRMDMFAIIEKFLED